MSASNDLENKLLDHVLGGGNYTRPATVYISLHTGDPGETGANEVASSNNYSRLAVTNDATSWPAAASGAKANGILFTFATPSGSWGTVSFGGMWDAASGGNFMMGGPLAVSKTINSGDPVTIPIGDYDVSLD